MSLDYKISYFEQIGNINVDEVIKNSISVANELGIKKIVAFSATKSSVLKLKNAIGDLDIQLIVATYSCNRIFSKIDENGKQQSFVIELGSLEAKQELANQGIPLIQGGIPLEPILSSTGDNATEMIVSSLNLISQGLTLCVNGAIMACENGYADENEQIISMSGDTSIVCRTSYKRNLFRDTFKIERILCKPL